MQSATPASTVSARVAAAGASPTPSGGSTMIQQTVLDLLQFARREIREHLDLDGCPHNGWRDPFDRHCIDCETTLQCGWLQHCEDVTARPDNGLSVLFRMLEQSRSYVQDLVREWGHDSISCRCDTCRWLRKARRACLESARLLRGPTVTSLRLPRHASNDPHFWPFGHH